MKTTPLLYLVLGTVLAQRIRRNASIDRRSRFGASCIAAAQRYLTSTTYRLHLPGSKAQRAFGSRWRLAVLPTIGGQQPLSARTFNNCCR